jgi:hypothetical protein
LKSCVENLPGDIDMNAQKNGRGSVTDKQKNKHTNKNNTRALPQPKQ